MRLALFALVTLGACAAFSNGNGPRLCSDYWPSTMGCLGGVCEPLDGVRAADAGAEE